MFFVIIESINVEVTEKVAPTNDDTYTFFISFAFQFFSENGIISPITFIC